MEESVIKHVHDYGPHKCTRGHSYKIKFQTNKQGLTSGYLKVCQRCGKDEQREFNRSGNQVIRMESVRVSSQDEPGIPVNSPPK